MKKLLGLRAYARRRGVTLKTVQEAIAAGRIPVEVDSRSGKRGIDPLAADAAWAASTDFTKVPITARAHGGGGFSVALSDGVPFEDLPEPENPDDQDHDDPELRAAAARKKHEAIALRFLEARARKEEAQADKAELEVEQKAGILVPAEEARQWNYKLGREVLQNLLSFPNNVAPMVAGKTDVNEISIILETKLREALIALCGPGADE
jgi:hypothetical protein